MLFFNIIYSKLLDVFSVFSLSFIAKKCKINRDKELRSLRASLSSMNEELAGLKDGIEFSEQQLEVDTYCFFITNFNLFCSRR